MDVTVDVVGGDEEVHAIEDDATYDDLIRAAGFHPQEASVLVEGSPVPGDRLVDADRVRLLRLVRGGSGWFGGAPGSDRREMDGGVPSLPDGITVEPAAPDDRLDVLRVLDAAMLETDASALPARIDAGDIIVARFERTGSVVGALVTTRPEPGRRHVESVAVRRARRGRGIGSALVASAVRAAESDPEADRVTAAFDAALEGFYADLGFAAESVSEDGDGRLSGRRGVREADDGGA